MRRWGPLAVGLGLVVLVGLGILVDGGAYPLADRIADDAMPPLRTDAGLDVVRVLTDLGYGPAATTATVLGVLVALGRRRARDAIALIAGLALLFLLVGVTKDLFERPRPEQMLGPSAGFAYPSGHSAYATAWVAAAIVTGKRPLILAAMAIVVFVMVSRLYLGVHFLTDVLGGVALGAVVYGAVLRK